MMVFILALEYWNSFDFENKINSFLSFSILLQNNLKCLLKKFLNYNYHLKSISKFNIKKINVELEDYEMLN